MPAFVAFRSPAFRILWCSSLALNGAQWMERTATAWLALETGGGPLAVGVVLAARMLPSLLFGLASGTLADRRDRRRLLLAAAAAAAGLALALGGLTASGTITLAQITAIAFLYGCLQVADTPARQALLVDTVGRVSAPNAIALNQAAARLFAAAGALAGGVAIATIGIPSCYAIVAAGYLACFAFLAVLRVHPIEPLVIGPHLSFGRSLLAAGRLILDLPAVRTLVLAAMSCEIFAFSFQTIVPGLARDVLGSGATGLGILNAASAVGATVAVALLAGFAGHADRGPRREPLLAIVYVLFGLSLVGLALAPSLLAAAAAVLVVGGCAAAFDTLQQTMLQLAVPAAQRGRAAGVWAFSIGTGPFGNLEVGALAEAIGGPGALLVNGALVGLAALILFARAPAYRWGAIARAPNARRPEPEVRS